MYVYCNRRRKRMKNKKEKPIDMYREERSLIPRQYKLLIMRPAFTCLLIGPPCLLGKIERSHDRPSLTPNALRARHGSFFSAPSSSPSSLHHVLRSFTLPPDRTRPDDAYMGMQEVVPRVAGPVSSLVPFDYRNLDQGTTDASPRRVDSSLVDRSLRDDPRATDWNLILRGFWTCWRSKEDLLMFGMVARLVL